MPAHARLTSRFIEFVQILFFYNLCGLLTQHKAEASCGNATPPHLASGFRLGCRLVETDSTVCKLSEAGRQRVHWQHGVASKTIVAYIRTDASVSVITIFVNIVRTSIGCLCVLCLFNFVGTFPHHPHLGSRLRPRTRSSSTVNE